MRDIPLNAKVECIDGSAGRSSYVILDPFTDRVTHLVVMQNGLGHTERLVPVDVLEATTPDLIRLGCTRDELRAMEPFIGRYIIRRDRPRFDQGTYPPYPQVVPHDKMTVEEEFKRIPRGELALHRGAHVQATNGRVGKVSEFLVDRSDHHITHLVLREGHLLNRRDVIIPVSAIDRIARDTIYLNLTKDDAEALPAGPSHKPHA